MAVDTLLGGHHHHHFDANVNNGSHGHTKKSSRASVDKEINEDVTAQPCCSSGPVHQLKTLQDMASVLVHEKNNENDDGW